jgi:hypothetical protein
MGLFSNIFGKKDGTAYEGVPGEVAAAIALAIELERGGTSAAASTMASVPPRATQSFSAWNFKGYGLTQMPQRKR